MTRRPRPPRRLQCATLDAKSLAHRPLDVGEPDAPATRADEVSQRLLRHLERHRQAQHVARGLEPVDGTEEFPRVPRHRRGHIVEHVVRHAQAALVANGGHDASADVVVGGQQAGHHAAPQPRHQISAEVG